MILTPQQLWKDYDRKSLPLAVSVVSGENTGAYLVRYVYFNGEKTADGVARVYAKLYEPDGAPKTAATVVFDDPDKAVDAFDPSEYLTRGIAVLVIDYTGDAPDKTRYTLYPKSLSYANFSKADLFGEKGSEPDRCCWHTWAISGMRAVTFLESEGYSDIFALGVGYGGLQVWKMCYLEGTVRAGAVIFSGPFAQDASLSYKASVAAAAYAGLIKSPVYIQITSNEQNGSLDYMNELYELSAANGAYFSICARANRVIDPDRADNIAKWFCTHLNGERLPAPPEITAKGSQNQLYYELKTPRPDQIAETELFIAHAQKNSAFRNWRKVPIESVGEDEYLAKVSVLSPQEPVYTFANIKYKNGLYISSAVKRVIPSALNVSAAALTFKRLIYDSSMALSDWLVLYNPGGKSVDLSMEKGPFDLEGITSPSHVLSTFRLADPQYRGKSDSVLQVTVYSPKAQTVLFHITASEKPVKYSCKKELTPESAWTKLTFSPNDFKSATGSLSEWNDVLTFDIASKDTVLVSSVLWV